MAAIELSLRLQEEVTCPVCREVFTDPVTVDCGHSVCRGCLPQSRGAPERPPTCPECEEPIRQDFLESNRRLRTLALLARQLGQHFQPRPEEDGVCGRHQEDLDLFCEEDKMAICLVCSQSRDHRGHGIVPLEEASREYKAKFQATLANLSEEIEDIESLLDQEKDKVTLWKELVESQRQSIQKEFEKMRRFLVEEEKFHLQRLECEDQKMMCRRKENKEELSQRISSLRELAIELQGKMETPDLELLQDVRDTLNRIDSVKLQRPQPIPMHLKTVCQIPATREMLSRFTENVTLDKDTANPMLIISEDGRRLRAGVTALDLPERPQRFDRYPLVLGSPRFTSGIHYWEVDLGDWTAWTLGVCRESVDRKGAFVTSPENGFWVMSRNMTEGVSGTEFSLKLRELPQNIGVLLDYEAGDVSFYSVPNGILLFAFSNCSFSGPVRPYFGLARTGRDADDSFLTINPVVGMTEGDPPTAHGGHPSPTQTPQICPSDFSVSPHGPASPPPEDDALPLCP
ncbi:E3 ubiquitin-protein ligase TRIM11-like [Ornithorhynchus anatinus]|uniref:E3 ubiquitin-protein ligase TRIM11-like n=1 Tax=Ornithorhynchus anatinus TaxID=9258 RepID=UPI0010A7F894|nr:E3 ubiquitin-protein ligase TRIM11-like [Ornithorhynchus anatinus]